MTRAIKIQSPIFPHYLRLLGIRYYGTFGNVMELNEVIEITEVNEIKKVPFKTEGIVLNESLFLLLVC